jgi:predicted nucleic-acid-binding Zn-ribbon protein
MEEPVNYGTHAKCPKCGNNQFELAALHLTNTTFSPWVIQCKLKEYGAILGVVSREDLDYHSKHS